MNKFDSVPAALHRNRKVQKQRKRKPLNLDDAGSTFVDLLSEIILNSHPLNGIELRLEPVGVLFLAH